jgi:CBS domain-containing protein
LAGLLVTVGMLQLNYNTSSNVIAVIPDVTGSYSGSLLVEFKYDYLYGNVSHWVTASVISNNNYLIANIPGNQLPTASGLYTVNFYESSLTQSLVWSTWTPEYNLLNNTWISYSGSFGLVKSGSTFDVERAFVSGSNEVSIYQYLSGSNIEYSYNEQ